jgi:hypothetical protein
MLIDGVFRIRIRKEIFIYDDELTSFVSNFKIYEATGKNNSHKNSQLFNNFNVKRK